MCPLTDLIDLVSLVTLIRLLLYKMSNELLVILISRTVSSP